MALELTRPSALVSQHVGKRRHAERLSLRLEAPMICEADRLATALCGRTTSARRDLARRRRVGKTNTSCRWVLLMLSGAAGPLGWLLLGKSERWGPPIVRAGCAVLFLRDVAMVFTGAPRRLRPLPAVLLLIELATAGVVLAAGAEAWLCRLRRAATPRTGPPKELAPVNARPPAHDPRREPAAIAAAATFLIHTVRQAIYVSPGHGRRENRLPPRMPPCRGPRARGLSSHHVEANGP